jgi:hypothetical protein
MTVEISDNEPSPPRHVEVHVYLELEAKVGGEVCAGALRNRNSPG